MSDSDDRAGQPGARFASSVGAFNRVDAASTTGSDGVLPPPPLPLDPSGYDREMYAVAVLGRRLLALIDAVEPLARPATAAPGAAEPCPACGGQGWIEVKVVGAGGSFSGISHDHDACEQRPCPACQPVISPSPQRSPEQRCMELWATFVALALPEAAAQAGHTISEETFGLHEGQLRGVLQHLLQLRLSGDPLALGVRQVAVALLHGTSQ